MDLRQAVFDNLDAGMIENGYNQELLQMTPLQIGHDMVAYAADVENQQAEDLVPHITAWLVENGHTLWS